MGRKRLTPEQRENRRMPISISLPPKLIQEFDRSIGEETRSRAIERIISEYLHSEGIL